MKATTLNRSISLTVLEKSETIYLLSSLINKACVMTAVVGAGSGHTFVLSLSAQLLLPEVPSAHSTATAGLFCALSVMFRHSPL